MNELLSSFMIYGLAVVGGTSPLDPGLEGHWIKEGLSPAACAASGQGQLVVTLRGLTLADTHCDFNGPLPSGLRAIAGTVSCEGAGESFESDLRLLLQEADGSERATISFDHTRATGYRRCP